MNVIVFGASGMVGQGVLRECLLDGDVDKVLVVGRSSVGQSHAKLREILLPDLTQIETVAEDLRGFDACLFTLGVSSVGMSEVEYARVTYELTIQIARVVLRENPGIVFEYVSGASTDSSEKGRVMWARVKGRTENELLRMPFREVYMLRPGFIQPMHGVRSKTGWYNVIYDVIRPMTPILRKIFPRYVTTTEELGRVMVQVAKRGASKRVLEMQEITQVV